MIKLKNILLEIDDEILQKTVKYKDEDSGEDREVKVSTALSYPKDHPAHKEAKKLTGGKDKDDIEQSKQQDKKDKKEEPEKKKSGEEEKKDVETGKSPEEDDKEPKGAALFKPGNSAHDIAKKQDAEHGKQDSEHGKDHGHGHHGHGHKKSNLSRRQRLAIAAADVAVKALHIQGLEYVAGQIESISSEVKEVVKEHKEADTFLGKLKTVGKIGLAKLKRGGQEMSKNFVNSLHDENTGQRKSLGKVIANKGAALAKSAYNGIKTELEHIGHGMKDGVEVAKKVLKDGPRAVMSNEDDKEKIVNAVRAVADVAIIGLAVSAWPFGAALKAASLAIGPGKALQALVTADVYADLMRSGKLRIIRESRISDYTSIIKLIESDVESKIDSLTDETLFDLMMNEGANELQKDESPLKSYSAEDMSMTIDYGVYMQSVIDAKNDKSNKQALIAAAKQKKASEQSSGQQPTT